MEIIECTPDFKEDAERICLAAGSEHARTDAVHGAFAKLMYCDAYVEHGIGYLVLDEDPAAEEEGVPSVRPVGYVLCAPDFGDWLAFMEPYFAQIRALPGGYGERIEGQVEMYRAFAEEYPAHLHIDIVPGCTGGGKGSQLMGRLCDRLRAMGVPGVMLGVARANEGAVRFYRRCGFAVLTEDEGGLTMGLRLA